MTTSNLYCIWYPSGGYGHFLNAVVSLYGNGFARPKNNPVFSANGNSHALDTVAPVYFKDQPYASVEFDPLLKYSILIDNGITNNGDTFRKNFPNANIIKLCYSDFSWPVVANTMIVKAQRLAIQDDLAIDTAAWPSNDDWVQREKYFLYLRDHALRHTWQPSAASTTLMIEDLVDYDRLRQQLGIELEDFSDFWQQWWNVNKQYFSPILTSKKILQGEFEPVSDVWTQAVVYYQIWCQYGVEVPHNEYSKWFESYKDIVKMLNKHGVNVDSN